MTVTPTATDRSARALAKRLIAKKGCTLLLRQPTRVESTSGSTAGQVVSSPLSVAALLVNGALLAGATQADLDAASVTGLLVAGDELVFAGHATTYTVTGGPYAAAANAIENVNFSPALTAGVGNNEACAVTFSGSDTTIKGFRTDSAWRMVDGHLTKVGDFRILVSTQALEALGVTVTNSALVGKVLFLGDAATAKRSTILAVEPISSGELDAAAYLVVSAD